MKLGLAGIIELRTARVGDHVETHAFLDGRPVPLPEGALDALTTLISGRVLSKPQAALLARLGVLAEQKGSPVEDTGLIASPTGRVALRRTFVIECEQPQQPSSVGPVHPASSVPISAFVPPRLLGPMQHLTSVLHNAWLQLWKAAIARDTSVDLPTAADLLAELARREVERSAELSAAFAIEEPFRLAPRRPLQADAVAFPIAGLRFASDRAWRSRGGRFLQLPLVDGGAATHLAAAGRLLGALAGGVAPDQVAALFAASPEMVGIAEAVDALDALVPVPARPLFDGQVPPGTVVHLGHATLLANLGGAHVLIDPWLPPASRGDDPPPPAPFDLPALAAIFISHHHWDHVHAETLLLLDKRVPIYVPDQDPEAALWPRTATLLRYLGFTDVRVLAHGDAVELGTGGRVTAAAFTGEDPCAIGWTGNTYVLEHERRAALVHVDAGPDRNGASTVSSGVIRQLRERHGALSPVFATRRQELGCMLDYGWELLLAPATDWVTPTENCATGSRFLAALCRDAGAATLVLYSEGGAPWYPPGTNFLAGPDQHAQVAPYQHLWETLSEIDAALGATGVDTILSAPYRRYRIGGGADGEIEPPAR